MSSITNLSPTTELDAVNAMLSAIGESPLPNQAAIDTATAADVVMAVGILKSATREVLAYGWRFNTNENYQLPITATYNWTEPDSTILPVSIYKQPATMISFKLSTRAEMLGLDLVQRLSTQYQEVAAYVPVLYDRIKSRDGVDPKVTPKVWVDPVWFMDFEQMPESARKFTTILASRRFQENVVGSTELDRLTATDERLAYVELKRDQARDEHYNVFNNPTVLRGLGSRPLSGIDY